MWSYEAGVTGARMLSEPPVSRPHVDTSFLGHIERVVVISDDSTESGGAAVIALLSARLLRQAGVPVTLITGDQGRNPELDRLGVDIVPLNGRHILQGNRGLAAARGIYSPQTHRILESWIRLNDTPSTIYHLHNWHKVLSPSVFAALSAVDDRLFLSAHDYFLACPNGSFMHFPREQLCTLTPMSAKCLCEACDKRKYAHKLWRVARHAVRQMLFDARKSRATVLAVHGSMIEHLVRGGIPAEIIEVLPNPVMPWSRRRVEAEHNDEVFYVGRVEMDKGVAVAARAARKAGAKLKVAGDGPLREELMQTYPEVDFIGRLSRLDLSHAVRGARVVVVPSKTRETFGLTAIEALASGIPVIVSKLVPIADDIATNGLGFAFDPSDEGELASLLEGAMRDSEGIASMSQRAFEAAHLFAPDARTWCSAMLNLYKEKLQHRGH